MEFLRAVLPWLQIIFSVLLIAGVLLQQNDAGLSSAFGGSSAGGSFHTKRGLEKKLFIGTIVIAVLFALSALVTLFIK